MKKVLPIVIVALILIAIIGVVIFINGKDKNVQINIDELATKISESGAFEDQLIKVDSEMTMSDYGFTNEEVRALVSYQGSGATSEEIVVLEVNDKSNVDSVKGKINTRITDRKEAFASYLPKEVGKIDSNIMQVKGNYVIFCISNDSNKVNNVINEVVNR